MVCEICVDVIMHNNPWYFLHAAGGRKPCVAFVGSS